MELKSGAGSVLHTATVFIGATGCVLLCYRIARLLAVGLALGVGKRGQAGKSQPQSDGRFM